MLGLGNLLSRGKVLGFPNQYSFEFDGSNDYLKISNTGLSLNDFSISGWFYHVDNGEDFQGIIGMHDTGNDYTEGLIIQFYDDYLDAEGASIDSHLPKVSANTVGSGLSASAWNHFAYTVDRDGGSGGVKLYINGSEATTDTAVDAATDANNIYIGAGYYSSTVSRYFNGKIDEVAIFDTILSASDISKLASKPLNLSLASAYATDRTSNLKLWLRAGDKGQPEKNPSITRSDYYTDFDGTNDYVDCGDGSGLGFSGDDPLTITAWINPSTVDTNKVITGFGSDTSSSIAGKRVALYLSSQKPYFAFWSTDVYHNGNVIEANKWQHLAITYKGGNTTTANSAIYLDGESLALSGGTASALDLSDMDWLRIGADQVPDQEFAGKIANTSIYKTALDAQTIKQFAKSRFTPMRDNRFSVVDFDGSNDYINCGTDSSLQLTDSFTASAWALYEGTSSIDDAILGWGFNYGENKGVRMDFIGIGSDPSFKIRFFRGVGSTISTPNSSSTLSQNTWYHITLTYDGSTEKIYINGLLDNSQSSSTSTSIDTDEGFSIGADSAGTPDSELDGQVSQVAIYSDVKDADFIYAQYAKGITADYSSDSNLVGYWRMGSGTGDAYPTIKDQSSNSNDGTITNGALDDIQQQMVAGYDMGAFESTGEELSVEVCTDPSFDKEDVSDGGTGTYWQVSAGGNGTLSISDGKLISTATSSNDCHFYVAGTDELVSGQLYKCVLTLTSYTSGRLRELSGSGSTTPSGAGTYTFYWVADQTAFDFHTDGVGIWEMSEISVKPVLQSADLSDTYPAIIDVNEPVLGAEETSLPFANSGSYAYTTFSATSTGFTASEGSGVNDVVTARMWTGDNSGKIYKITFDLTINSGATPSLYWSPDVDGGNGSGQTAMSSGSNTIYKVNSGSTYDWLLFNTSGATNYEVSNFLVKEVQGNPGTMTNQAAGDLVYSSVLPDQSYLTGVNSAYNYIDLDGSDEYISVANESAFDYDIDDAFSCSFWLNNDATSGDHTFMGKGTNTTSSSWLVRQDGSGCRFNFSKSGSQLGNVTASGVFSSSGSWIHIVVTYNGGSNLNGAKIYVNGSLSATGSDTAFDGSLLNNDALAIGSMSGGGTYYNGKIGQSAFYNKALSATEVSAIYSLGRHANLLDSYSDNLVGYWAMSSLDASTGLSDVGNGTIYDRSGQSNHGTATNTEAADLASSPNAEPNGYAKGDTIRDSSSKA